MTFLENLFFRESCDSRIIQKKVGGAHPAISGFEDGRRDTSQKMWWSLITRECKEDFPFKHLEKNALLLTLWFQFSEIWFILVNKYTIRNNTIRNKFVLFWASKFVVIYYIHSIKLSICKSWKILNQYWLPQITPSFSSSSQLIP